MSFIARLVPDVMQSFWSTGNYPQFYNLRDAARKYDDLVVFEDQKGVLFFSSQAVNFLPKPEAHIQVDWMFPIPEASPVSIAVSYLDSKLKQRIYASPPRVEFGCLNPSGFGLLPRPGWEADMLLRGFSAATRLRCEKHLLTHPPISYRD